MELDITNPWHPRNTTMILLFVLAVASITLIASAYAEPFPSIAYYEERQQLAREQYIPEPKQYPIFWINPLPEQVECDTWFKVTGHVHYEHGVLFVSAWSPYISTGNDTGLLLTQDYMNANLSYQTDYELQNWIKLPCGIDGEWSLQFSYYPNPDARIPPGVSTVGTVYMSLHDVEVVHP